ncbi:hypothetical protein LSCM1_00265 [Leishmania martiniquensis]|uniref:DEAD/DEAH box helicase n=1 Tax=Leishmania martiniquensis TaxID=1580590 RepID=A0A836GF55_9TRYP|nr:hypothetical protein LSCM1_00265 [Leishmania martiniquensis]
MALRRAVLRGGRSSLSPLLASIRCAWQPHSTLSPAQTHLSTDAVSASSSAGPSLALEDSAAPGSPRGPREADLLFDVLGVPEDPPPHAELETDAPNRRAWRMPRNAFSASLTNVGREGRASDASVPASAPHVQQAVRQAVLHPLCSADSQVGGSELHEPKPGKSAASSSSSKPDLWESYKVIIVDALGMPADLPKAAPGSFEDLLELSPSILRTQLQKLMERKRYRALTPVQAAVIPLMLEHRDLLCIAPTATGKTLCYVYAALLHLLLKDMGDRSAAMAGSEGGGVSLNRRQVETFLHEKISKGEICPYCELSIVEVRVCPTTGFPHASVSEIESDFALRSKERRAMRLEELQSSVAEPRVLVLVPNSPLASQVSAVFRSLHCDYRIRSMVRASSAEEQRKYLHALEDGADVLVASPETILPALYKRKLSLRRVQTVVMDEVDDIVSVNHFEPMKIILGALPKGALRPQRLLFGASLPPVAYEMIRTTMLLPSHRFVLVDLKAPAERRRATPSPLVTSSSTPSSSSSLSTNKPSAGGDGDRPAGALSATVTGGLLTARTNLRHLVFMVGRAEKVQKLAWLYETGKLSPDQRTLIFCNSRHNVAYVCDKMKELVSQVNFTTLTSHASSTAREGVLKMFRTGVSTSLICTDLLSRGIDFQGVVYVVHYDMPTDMETWMHRCGRCGRGGLLQGKGYVYTFFQPENIKLAKPLVGYLRQHQQLVPPKLREYANQSFIDVFNNSLFHHPTRPYRKDDPQNSTPVLGRCSRRFPDYKQGIIHKYFRPQ